MYKEIKKAIQISNQEYNIVIKRLHLYNHMKMVTLALMKKETCNSTGGKRETGI